MSRALSRVVAIGACAWIAFWACAPPMTMPPPVPLPEGARRELGGAAVLAQGASWWGGSQAAGGMQFWSLKQRPRGGQLVWSMAIAPDSGASGIGLGYQKMGRGGRLGVSVEGGWAYARLGAPVVIPLPKSPNTWFYARPSIGSPSLGAGHLPVGVQTDTGDGLLLRVEVGLHALGYMGPVVGYGAAGLSKQF